MLVLYRRQQVGHNKFDRFKKYMEDEINTFYMIRNCSLNQVSYEFSNYSLSPFRSNLDKNSQIKEFMLEPSFLISNQSCLPLIIL